MIKSSYRSTNDLRMKGSPNIVFKEKTFILLQELPLQGENKVYKEGFYPMKNRGTIQDFIGLVEDLAPLYLAEDWDNCGLQLGDTSSFIERAVVSLDVTEEVIDQALEKGASLLICHHPLFFAPLKRLDLTTSKGRIIKKALEGGLAIYAAHTNLDNCAGGINDYLASLLGLEDTKPLKASCFSRLYKLVVYVPSKYADKVREAISKRGAGFLGNYSHCSFQVKGEGTFKPLEGSQPFIGAKGRLERVEEVRLETIITREERESILEAMMEAHPYEEVAYDIYPLENRGSPLGPGRWGYLREGLPLLTFVERAQEIFGSQMIELIGNAGDMRQTIERAALCGGSGGDLLERAIEVGAQIYITGDLKYHQLQLALENQLLILSIYHHVTERVGLMGLRDYLLKKGQERGFSFELIMAEESFPVARL